MYCALLYKEGSNALLLRASDSHTRQYTLQIVMNE